MKKKLTSSQKDALVSLLREGPVDNIAALVRFGSQWRRTLLSLADRGFVRHFAIAETWRITSTGRSEVDAMEAEAAAREHQKRQDDIVRQWRGV